MYPTLELFEVVMGTHSFFIIHGNYKYVYDITCSCHRDVPFANVSSVEYAFKAMRRHINNPPYPIIPVTGWYPERS